MKTINRVRLKQVCDGRIRFAVERVAKPRDVYEAVLPYYRGADREILSTLCLDAQNQPSCFNVASIGALNTTRTRPADILKAAIMSNALGLVLIHYVPRNIVDLMCLTSLCGEIAAASAPRAWS